MDLRRIAVTLLLVVAPLLTRDAATQAVRRTPWGDPDLQGVWPGGPVFAVPFERDPALGARRMLTAEETARLNADVDAQAGFVTGNSSRSLDILPR